MFPTPKTAVVLVLMLVLSHAPIPWLHDHFGADDRQLAFHLRLFHSNAADDELPRGWHIHLLPFEMVAGDDVPAHWALYFAQSISLHDGLPAAGDDDSSSGAFPATILGKGRRLLSLGSSRSTCVAMTFGIHEVHELCGVLLL